MVARQPTHVVGLVALVLQLLETLAMVKVAVINTTTAIRIVLPQH
jgi:CHASE1-domain containing sensor protein